MKWPLTEQISRKKDLSDFKFPEGKMIKCAILLYKRFNLLTFKTKKLKQIRNLIH